MTRLGGFPAALALGLAAIVGLPSAGLALGAIDGQAETDSVPGTFAIFTPASIDPRLAELVASRADGNSRPMRFTPAGIAKRGDQSVTVAVRVDGDAARAISVRSAIAAARADQMGAAQAALNSTRYDLGIARGYQSFAQPRTEAIVPAGLGRLDMPDLATFQPSEGVRPDESRFTARLQLEEDVNAGRAPRTAEGQSDPKVDVAAGFRVTRNLDLTAGLRFQQERNRLAPLTNGEQDSKAVYVGTQFRF